MKKIKAIILGIALSIAGVVYAAGHSRYVVAADEHGHDGETCCVAGASCCKAGGSCCSAHGKQE